MATTNKIRTTELDFDQIKQNLKEYLRGQSQFSDYDFEGSGLSVLLDILAYNTHYNALYQNLAVNEAFLDSASKRSSVVSKARELGYIPYSARASTASVNIVVINNDLNAPTTLVLPAGLPFTTSVDGKNYTFYNVDVYSSNRVGNQYVFQNVILKEGIPLQNRYVIEENQNTVVIPNGSVDSSTIKVVVQDNAQSTVYHSFVESASILNIGSTDQVYFIKENQDQLYELEFGNGAIGKALVPGNVVTVDYMVCSRNEPNGARTFVFAGTISGANQIYVTTLDPAFGGAAAEDIDSIKWNAPRSYAAQNRCVTADDYRAVIMQLYPNAQAVNVWGGQESNPPQYGKVYISVIPTGGDFLSTSEKEYILDTIINPRKALTVTPEIVDPTYIKIEISSTVYYNPQQTIRQAGDISSLAYQAITDYNDMNLNTFGSVFKFSKLTAAIDSSEPSITSNITTLKLHREIEPVYNVVNNYTINLGNPIYNSGVPEESVRSTGIYTDESSQVVYIDDLPVEGSTTGQLRLYYISSAGVKIVVRTCGTVQYDTGVMTIDNLNITGLADSIFELVVKGQSNDVVSTQNQFVKIDPAMITVNALVDTPYKTYQFTSSRN